TAALSARESYRRMRAEYAAQLSYSASLRQIYQQAAARPWIDLPPLPPMPRWSSDIPVWIQNRDYAKVLAFFDKILETDPENVWALDGRAWFLATSPDARVRDGPRAVASATRACELTGWTDPVTLDTLAAAYAEVGDFDRAVRRQEDALLRFLGGEVE